MSPQRFAWKTGLFGSLIALLVVLTPLASASGSGYSLSFTQGSGHASNSAVDIVSLSSTDPGGSTISVTMTVSGTINTASTSYVYLIFFGGSSTTNATAWASFTDGTNTWESSSGGGFGFGYLYPTISGGSISFSMNKSAVGPASTFAMNGYAAYGATGSGGTYSWLGSSYSGLGNGGGATCTTNATCQAAVSNAIGLATWIAVGVLLLVVVIVVVVVLVVVMRRRRSPPAATMMPPPPMGGAGAPPPPPPPAQ